MATLTVHPDRLLSAEPEVRTIARRLYEAVRDLPIVSPHGHVDPRMLLDDEPFTDPASLFIQPDHYVTRLLHAGGMSLDRLGVAEGPLPEERARKVWRLLCENWHLLRGTPVRYWFDSELGEIFGVRERPRADNADALYDQIAEQLAAPDHRPRALLRRFGIEVMATTDDPADDLDAHARLAQDPEVRTRVVPTFRPDRYLEPAAPGWVDAVKRLGEAAGTDVDDYAGYVATLEERRRYFVEHGAVSADHGHADAIAAPLEEADARGIYRSALSGQVREPEGTAFRRHMILEMARMSCDDGLVMTVHPESAATITPGPSPSTGRTRATTFRSPRSSPTRCARCWTATEPTRTCTSCCSRWTRTPSPARSRRRPGSTRPSTPAHPGGSSTAPALIRRYQESVSEIAGFSRMSGFIDDTRAFCSIPARHDMSRRLDAAFLAELVATHRLEEDEALDALTTLVVDQPRKVFKL